MLTEELDCVCFENVSTFLRTKHKELEGHCQREHLLSEGRCLPPVCFLLPFCF